MAARRTEVPFSSRAERSPSQSSTLAGNQAVGGAGGIGGRGGTAGFGGVSAFGLPVGDVAGHGGTGGTGGSAYGGGIRVSGGTVVLLADTLNANSAKGGQGGTGGLGGSGPIALLFGGSGIVTGTGVGGSTLGGGGGSAINSAGAGGDGGIGGNGYGGGLYLSAGALTLTNATVADNTADAGSSGTGGQGGHAGTGNVTGGVGAPGAPGRSFGGGAYVNGGAVSLFNSTIALNTQSGTGSGGGVVQAAGTVTAVSTLIGGNGAVNYSGNITATDCLFQTAPTGTLTGSGNIVGKDPLLATAGLQNNGGPTLTIALQATSPAIGKGANPQGLLTDQRGFAPRTGSGGTDIGAYEHDATSDTQHPTATFQATSVTSSNAASSIRTHSQPRSRTTSGSRSRACRAWSFKSFLRARSPQLRQPWKRLSRLARPTHMVMLNRSSSRSRSRPQAVPGRRLTAARIRSRWAARRSPTLPAILFRSVRSAPSPSP